MSRKIGQPVGIIKRKEPFFDEQQTVNFVGVFHYIAGVM
jgi:hypothetical protein